MRRERRGVKTFVPEIADHTPVVYVITSTVALSSEMPETEARIRLFDQENEASLQAPEFSGAFPTLEDIPIRPKITPSRLRATLLTILVCSLPKSEDELRSPVTGDETEFNQRFRSYRRNDRRGAGAADPTVSE